MAVVAVAALAVVALAAPGDPKRAIKPADQAHAKTILLRKADVPGKGWHGQPTDFGQVNPSCLVKHYSLSKLTANAEVGIQYTRGVATGTFLVESDVHVFATSGQARVAAGRLSKVGYGRCLGTALAAEAPTGSFATSSAAVLSITGLALPTNGFRITVKVITGGKKSSLTADVLGFRQGRTLTDLSVLTLDKGWSSAKVRSVAATLATRTAKP